MTIFIYILLLSLTPYLTLIWIYITWLIIVASTNNTVIVAITLNDELYSFQHANFTKISNNVKTVDLLDDITVALVYTRSMHNYF